jgi:outer membrane lipoprotein LolB
LKQIRHWWRLLLCIALLSGCAHLSSTSPCTDGISTWSGRLALQVENSAAQSFTAGFELKGSAQAGELNLFNPLGGTVARIAWHPGTATLVARGETRQFDSLDALVEQASGAPLPVGTLFDWLRGENTVIHGWQADLSHLGDGRMSATRSQPQPTATLRIVIDK